MLGGNATERRVRNERIWTGVGCLAASVFVGWWIATVEDVTAGQLKLFWAAGVFFTVTGTLLAWRYADADRGPIGSTVTFGALGVLLSNVFDNVAWLKPLVFGALAGFLFGGGVASLARVFVRTLHRRAPTTEQPGDSPGS